LIRDFRARSRGGLSGFGYGRPVPFKKQLRPLVVRWRHRGITPNDIFLSSYPRSGSTWLRFLLFEILTGEQALFGPVNRSIPYVGQQSKAQRVLPKGGRLIKTHERDIRGFARAVYIVRDARSIVLSEYRFMRHRFGYPHDFETFIRAFIAGRINPFGRWDAHVNYWLDSSIAQQGNILLVKFEDMRQDTIGTLVKITRFLNVQPDEEKIRAAIVNNDVARMRAKEETALRRSTEKVDRRFPFIGEGSASGWTSGLTDEQVTRLEIAMGATMERLGYTMRT
jgi:hypothetical protein